jgi:hypothetical protein
MYWDGNVCDCELDLVTGTCALQLDACKDLRESAAGEDLGPQGSEIAVGCDAVAGGCTNSAQGECPDGANYYFSEGGYLGLYIRPTDRNGNCLAAHGGGTVTINVNGPLQTRNGTNEQSLSGHCNEAGLGTQPIAAPFYFTLVDSRPPPVIAPIDPESGEPILPPIAAGSIELVVEHNRIDGGTERFSTFFTTCHYPTQP